MAENIFLIGFMGTGKSTVSRQLGNILKYLEIDMDAEIEHRQQMKINEMFSNYGEEFFRNLETSLLEEFRGKQGFIISCGGGVVLRPENIQHMKDSGIVVLLTAEADTIYQRVCRSKHRPLLKDNMSVEHITKMLMARDEYYKKAADITVKTDGRTPGEIAGEIVLMLQKGCNT